MQVFLDLYGVLLDSEKMYRGYRDKVAELLAARFGGDAAAWKRAHDEAFVAYVNRVDSADWEARGWSDIVDELDARNLLEILERVGAADRPENPLAFARALEREAMVSVDARFPDARTAVERLRNAGHRVHVATGGSETADAALQGAGLLPLVDRLFTGHSQNTLKSRRPYWDRILQTLAVRGEDCVLVDDRLDYLEPAAAAGIAALLLDRKGYHRPEAMPPYVRATLRTLAALVPWIEMRRAAEGP